MFIILGFYVVAILIILAVAVAVYRVFARRSRLLALGMSILVLSILILLWPIPIHGGFTILGEALYDEISREIDRYQDQKRQQKKEDFTRTIDDRFAGPIGYEIIQQLSDHWYRVQIKPSLTGAYFDTESKMLWSDWISFETAGELPSLKLAKGYCQQLEPMGYWALISEGENYLLWKAQGQHGMPEAQTSSMSQLVDKDFGIEMPSYVLRKNNPDNRRMPAGRRIFSLRCVARTQDAPAAGYVRKDIQLNEWNRYQLSKINGPGPQIK